MNSVHEQEGGRTPGARHAGVTVTQSVNSAADSGKDPIMRGLEGA